MKNPFATLFRARDKPKDAVSGAPSFYFGTSVSGKNVTAQSAIQLSTVYACVRVMKPLLNGIRFPMERIIPAGRLFRRKAAAPSSIMADRSCRQPRHS